VNVLRSSVLAVVCAVVVVLAPSLQAAGNDEQEARAAFARLVEVARKSQVDEFKKLVAAADLKEMEAMEKERAGFLEMFMGFIAESGNPDEYTADVKPNQITFVKRVSEKSSSGSSTQTTTVHMIRDGGQWKFGKSRP